MFPVTHRRCRPVSSAQSRELTVRKTARSFSLGRGDAAVCILFLGVAAALAWSADASFGFGLDQVSYNLVTEEILTAWERGQPLRNEHGSVLRQSFVLFLAVGERFLGSPEAGYRLILFLSAGAYLAAMYLLLVSILGDRKIAALTTVLSIVQRYTLGTSFWGMGEYQSILPRIVVLAVFPLAWLLFERHLRSPRVLLAFVVVALGFALHLSAVYFYCILLLTYGLHVLWRRAWPSLLNVAIATVFLWFALKAVPSSSWSHLMESSTAAAAAVALIGLGLVVCYARFALGPWMGVATVLYLSLGFGWLLGGATIQSIVGIGPKRAEPERPVEIASVEPAAPTPGPAGDPGVGEPADPAASHADDAGVPERPDRTAPAAGPGDSGAEPASQPPPADTAATDSAGTAGPGLPEPSDRTPPTRAEAAEPAAQAADATQAESDVPDPTPPTGVPDPTPSLDVDPSEPESRAVEAGAKGADLAPPTTAGSGPKASESVLESTNRALYARFGWMLFPISLATLGFALYNVGLLGAVALYELVYRWQRGATEREAIAGLYIFSALAVSLGLTAAVQLYCRLTGQPDIILELFRALRYLYLPLYIYLGFFLQRMWRKVRERPNARGRWLLAVLVAALLVSPRQALVMLPDSVKLLARSVVERSGSMNPGDPSQRRYLYLVLATEAERQEGRDRHRDYLKLCEWVKSSTAKGSVFLTTDYSFLHHAERDIMVSYQQGAGSARSMAVKSGHRAWHQAYRDISDAFASRSPERLLAAAREYGADYVVAPADQPPLDAAPLYANGSYALYGVSPDA